MCKIHERRRDYERRKVERQKSKGKYIYFMFGSSKYILLSQFLLIFQVTSNFRKLSFPKQVASSWKLRKEVQRIQLQLKNGKKDYSEECELSHKGI